MAPAINGGRKRKAVTRDSPQSDEAAIYDELGNKFVDDLDDEEFDTSSGDHSEESDAEDADSEDFDDDDEIDSDEIPSEDEDETSLIADKIQSHSNGVSLRDATPEDLDEDDLAGRPPPAHELTKDANGNLRFIYPEIDPVYDSDDSEAPATNNTIGNIPLSFYESYPHIGYDIDGKRIMRPAKGAALDSLLDSIDIPKGWTGLTDPATGKPLQLSEEELDTLKRLTRNELPDGEGYDPYPDMVEYFSGRLEQMPLSSAPEPKRRFVPSKHEAKRVMKIVKAIKEGRIQPYKPPTDEEEESLTLPNRDLWENEAPRADHPMHMPAPKLPPPGYDLSYHPPPEYIPDEEEKKEWEDQDEEDRTKDYLPKDHDALRKVGAYNRFVKDRFERSLDLYLAARVRRSKLQIDPESLLPKLPSPSELRPFPTTCGLIFSGHKGRVRSVAVDPRGTLLATGGDDGTVRVWTIAQARQIWHARLSDQDGVDVVSWRPTTEGMILAAGCGERVFLAAPEVALFATTSDETDPLRVARDALSAGWTVPKPAGSANVADSVTKEAPAKWAAPEPRLQDRGVLVQITLRAPVKVISWHRRGDYFVTVSPAGQSSAVAIHTLSKHLTQLPFRRLKGLAQAAHFHPRKPVLFVATQHLVRAYDLAAQQLLKILQPGARWISSFDVHPLGDNLIVGTYDKRLLWMDLDMSARPYKTLRYHAKAIRAVAFHKGAFPLFVDASDDGSLQVFHGKVYDDFTESASIVPLKVLKGHKVTGGLGVLDVAWCPREPWMVSAGADGTARLWRS